MCKSIIYRDFISLHINEEYILRCSIDYKQSSKEITVLLSTNMYMEVYVTHRRSKVSHTLTVHHILTIVPTNITSIVHTRLLNLPYLGISLIGCIQVTLNTRTHSPTPISHMHIVHYSARWLLRIPIDQSTLTPSFNQDLLFPDGRLLDMDCC